MCAKRFPTGKFAPRWPKGQRAVSTNSSSNSEWRRAAANENPPYARSWPNKVTANDASNIARRRSRNSSISTNVRPLEHAARSRVLARSRRVIRDYVHVSPHQSKRPSSMDEGLFSLRTRAPSGSGPECTSRASRCGSHGLHGLRGYALMARKNAAISMRARTSRAGFQYRLRPLRMQASAD